jgi:hypothetical protein
MNGTGTTTDGKPLTWVYDGFVRESDQQLHGAGVKKWSDGEIQEGNFRDGKLHGQGKCTLPRGSVYVGEYAQGKYHGRGRYTYANGDVYEGEFTNNDMNGQGAMTYTDGRRESGTWRDDKFVGSPPLPGTKFVQQVTPPSPALINVASPSHPPPPHLLCS